jgi:hypothetical protein
LGTFFIFYLNGIVGVITVMNAWICLAFFAAKMRFAIWNKGLGMGFAAPDLLLGMGFCRSVG